MINFTASIKPKGLTRYNDANITASLRQLLSTLRTSCNELDGKIDAKIKSLFNTAISSVSNAVSSNGTRGVGKAVADVKKLLSVTIPSKIKQAITKALDAVIKFFEWLESSAPDSERKKYSKEANEVFKQWKYKRKAIKAGKQTGEGPEITVINPHDDPTGANARDLFSKRAKIKSRNVPEEERKFAERIRSPQYAAEQKVKLNEQIAKDQKKLEKEARKIEKAGKLLTSNQSSQLKYIKEYMENNGFSRELKFKVYKEYAKNVYKFAGKEPEKVINTILESIKGKKYSLTSLLSGIKTKGIRKTQSRIARSTSRSISLARKRKSLNEMRRKLASCHVIIRNAKQIILQFKKIPQTYSELIKGFKEAQKLIVSSEEEIKDTEKLIDASEEAVIDAEKVEEVAKDASIEADKAEEAAQKEAESPTTTQAKVEKKEKEAEKKLKVSEKKEEEAKKTSEAAEKKVDIAEKKVDAIEKKVATIEKKTEALSELADKILKVTPAANAKKTANVAKTIAPISSAAKEINEADKKVNKAVEANNVVTLKESLMEYMDNHGLKARKGVVSGRFTQLVNNGQIKGTESLQNIISLFKLDNPDNAMQGSVAKTTTNTPSNKVEKNESIKANEMAEIIKESRDVEKILADMEKRTEFARRSIMGIRENGSIYMSPDALAVKVQQDELDNIRTLLNEVVKESATSPKKARNTLNIAKMRMRKLVKRTHFTSGKKKGQAKGEFAEFTGKLKRLGKVQSVKPIRGTQGIHGAEAKRQFSTKEVYNLGKIINNALVDKINDAAETANKTIWDFENLPLYQIQQTDTGELLSPDNNLIGVGLLDKQNISKMSIKLRDVVNRINRKLENAKNSFGYRQLLVTEKDNKDAVEEKKKLEKELSQTLYWIKSLPETLKERIKTLTKLYNNAQNKNEKEILSLKKLTLAANKAESERNIKYNAEKYKNYYSGEKKPYITPAVTTGENSFTKTYRRQVKKEVKETLNSLKELLQKGMSVLYNTSSTIDNLKKIANSNNRKAIGYDL